MRITTLTGEEEGRGRLLELFGVENRRIASIYMAISNLLIFTVTILVANPPLLITRLFTHYLLFDKEVGRSAQHYKYRILYYIKFGTLQTGHSSTHPPTVIANFMNF